MELPMTQKVVNISFAGKSRGLADILLQGRLPQLLEPILLEAGHTGNFSITPLTPTRGTTFTKGQLKFHRHQPRGVVGNFHPPAQGSEGNIQFLLSTPSGFSSEEFLTHLKDAQKEVEVKKTVEKAKANTMQTMNGTTHTQPQVESTSVFQDEDKFGLVIAALRSKAKEQGSEFLLVKTAVTVVKAAISCTDLEAYQALSELCDGELLVKKGKGPTTSYSVISDNPHKGGGEVADNLLAAMSNMPAILTKVKEARVRVDKAKKERTSDLATIQSCQARIQTLEAKVRGLDADIAVDEAFLALDSTTQAERVAELLVKFNPQQ